MAGQAEEREVLDDLAGAAGALGPLSADEIVFRGIVDALRAGDAESFRIELDRVGVLERCGLVCRWLCAKECVLFCLRACGPPPSDAPEPDPREFARVVSRIAADRELAEELAEAVQERHVDAFQELVRKYELGPFCHLVCHWICSIHCRLTCDWICAPFAGHRPHLVDEVVSAAQTVGQVADREDALSAVVKAFQTQDCELMRRTLYDYQLDGRCRIICEWLCTWQCFRVCLLLCRPFGLEPVEDEIPEMLEFARQGARLAEESGALAKLSDAVGREDAEAFGGLVRELELERFCIQLCHWVCFFRCRVFCRCVCRPVDRPWFTHVGHFHIYADIDSGTGLTNKAMLGHGGPGFGFFQCLELRGYCPKLSPTFPGAPMRYRFVYEQPPGNRVPLVGSLLCPVIVGSRQIIWDPQDGTGPQLTFQTVIIAGSGATPDPTPPVPGPPPPHVIVPDPDGWVAVDQQALDGGFVGALIGFNTPVAFAGGDPDPGHTLVAGNPVPGPSQRDGVDAAIHFEATRVGGPTSPPDFGNSLARIRINNWGEVSLLNLVQFHSGTGTPCSPLSTDLDVEYTADHELMAQWEVGISSAAPLPALSLPNGTSPRGGAGTHHENITSWQSCSYRVTLTTRRALTTGLVDDSAKTNLLTFCK